MTEATETPAASPQAAPDTSPPADGAPRAASEENVADAASEPVSVPKPDPAKEERERWRQKARDRAEARLAKVRETMHQRELREYQERIQKADADPLAYAQERGLTPQQIAQRLIEDGTPEATIRKLESKLEALQRGIEEREQRAMAEQRAQSHAKVVETFTTMVKSDAERYPLLSRLPKERVLSEAFAVANRATAKGHQYSDAEIAAHLEESLEKEADVYVSWHQEKARKAAERASAQSAPADGKVNGRQADKAGTPRTLTNGQASSRGTMPADFDKLSDREQNKILAQMLEGGWRG